MSSLYSLAGLDGPESKSGTPLPPPKAAVPTRASNASANAPVDERTSTAPSSCWSSSVRSMAPSVLTKKAAGTLPTARAGAASSRPRPPPPSALGAQTPGSLCGCTGVSAALTATAWYKDIKQPYDPARPNDYDEWVKDVEKQRKARELEAVLQRKGEEAAQAFNTLAASAPRADDGAVTIKRPRPLPSPPLPPQRAPPPPPPLPPGFTDSSGDPGLAMLQKMGWSEGQGLGKEGQGMKTPLVAKKSDGATGVIINASERRPSATSLPPPPPPLPGTSAAVPPAPPEKKGAVTFRGRPSRVLLLKNMVAPSEIDAELRGEIGEECSKYGEVIEVIVHEVAEESKLPEEECVRIFVKFVKQAAAMKAYIDLDGRYFGGRQVWVCFYREQDFDNGNLAPNPSEPK